MAGIVPGRHPSRTQTQTSAFDPSVGCSVGVVEGEDLVAPFEEGFGEFLELEEGMVAVGVEERSERLVGFVCVRCEVDAV